ncbi:MAG TPA: EamA family transporter [Bacteroidota bacterium]|nr:EamA family transporter [Bacteroidota bacterium]
MNERPKIIFLYVLICLIWGSTWLAIKIGLETMPPLFAAGLRFTLASAVLYAYVKWKKIPIPFDGRMKRFYATVALTSFSVPFAFVYWGEQHISSGLTAVLFGIYPFSVALFSYFFLPAEKLNASKVAGIILGFLGVFVIFANDIRMNDPLALWGMTAVVASAVMQAFSVIVIKKEAHTVSPFVTLLVPTAISCVILLASSLAIEDLSAVSFTPAAIASIFYLAVIGSVVTFVSYFWLLKHMEAVLLALSAFVTPIIAVTLGVVLNNEVLSSQTAAGAGFVLAGIIIANAADIRRMLVKAHSPSA